MQMLTADTLSPPTTDRRTEVAAYVAGHVLDGRRLFDVMSDPWVHEQADEGAPVLDDVARDPLVRACLALRPG